MTDFSLVRGRRLRATRTNGCGSPILGPDSRLVTKGFISVTLTPNNEPGEAITVTNANGETCVSDPAVPRFVNMGVAGTFCGVMPELFSWFTSMPVVRDAAGLKAIGIDLNSKVNIDASGVALELWSAVPQGICDDTGQVAFGYFGLPFIKGGTMSGITIENGAINFGIEGATTRDGNAWGAGPYDVELDENGIPGPLNTPLDPYTHFRLQLVNVEPPEVTVGPQALGVPATAGVAGSPGTFTPANSYAPLNLEGMAGLTATPGTAWTAGQYVRLRDGSLAHWSGTAWVAGAA